MRRWVGRVEVEVGIEVGVRQSQVYVVLWQYESKDKRTALGLGAAVFVDTGNSDGAVAGDQQSTAYLYGAAEQFTSFGRRTIYVQCPNCLSKLGPLPA